MTKRSTVTSTAELESLVPDYARLLRNGNTDPEQVAVLTAGILSFLAWSHSYIRQREGEPLG